MNLTSSNQLDIHDQRVTLTFISCIVDTLCIEAIISESNGGDIPPGQPKI